MLLPLVYYLVAFVIYAVLYEYDRHHTRKQIVTSDFLENLPSIPSTRSPISHKRSFDQIKKEIASNCYFNRIRITFGIDLSASNEWQGRVSFQKQSLHKTQTNQLFNPYQKAISELGVVFEEIFASKLEYSCFIFGDEGTKDCTYFPLIGSGEKLNNYQRVLEAYLEKMKDAVLSGPTSFAPIIKQLLVYGIHCPKDLTILIILTDELKISHEDQFSVRLIRQLANLANVCLILVGVGDGPWERMSYEEHRLRESIFRKLDQKETKISDVNINPSAVSYDNFHFVAFNSWSKKLDKNDTEDYLARAVLTKLPTQLKQALRHNQNAAWL